jgi:hypothetical protein
MLRAHVHAAFPYPCCMSISMLHVHDHTACSWPCCMSMPLLYIQVYAARTWTWTQYGLAACTWTYRVDMDMQHGHGHVARTLTCSMDTWTWAWSMDMILCIFIHIHVKMKTFLSVYINVEMLDYTASSQWVRYEESNVPEVVRYWTKPTQSGIFFGPVPDWNYGCWNADAAVGFLDADAQLCCFLEFLEAALL